MTVTWIDIVTAWTFRPALALFLGLLGWVYWRGTQNTAAPIRARKYFLSLVVVLFAMSSPLNQWARHYFFIHVAQHLLLISLFPALFMGSNPFPVLFDGLPQPWNRRLAAIFRDLKPKLKRITPKSVCWFLFIAVVWLWYDPALHALTLRSPLLYDLAIIMMMSGALLHWWHVMAAAPHLHSRLPGFTHMGYALIGAAPLKIPGLIFLFAYLPFYSYTAGTFLGFEIDPLLSQRLGGIVVWSLGGVVYSTTAVGFLSGWLAEEAEKPEQPRSVWDNKENFVAPHLE